MRRSTSSRRSSPQPLPSLATVRAEKARRRLAEFIRQGWHVVEPGTPYRHGWHIDAICEHLEAVTRGQIQNLLINIPPGHMKSLITSVFWPAWIWLQRPEWRGLFSSYGLDLALRDSRRCRELLESEWYRGLFALLGLPTWELAGDQNVKSYYENTRRGFRFCHSVGGRTTGFRGDALVVDDPLNATDAHSKAARDEVLRWWKESMPSRLNDQQKGVKVVIMQRLHEEDLSGAILEEGGYDHLCLPTEFEAKRRSRTSIGWADPRRTEGELLFPAMFPAPVVAKLKKSSMVYAGQYQQRPVPAEGGMFKRTWWRFWRFAWEDDVPELKDRTVVVPDDFDEMLLSWDCTFKKTDTSDFVAGGAWGRKGANKYLLDLVWDRLSFTETIPAFRRQAADFPDAQAKLVEDKANGPAVINTLQGEIPGIIAVEPQGSKEARAAASSPQVEAGNVFLPLHAPWRDRYIEEHASFPRAAHDDTVDQQSQALLRFQRPEIVIASAYPKSGLLNAR